MNGGQGSVVGGGYDVSADTGRVEKTQHLASPSRQRLEKNTLREIYTAEIGIRETTGRNDGPRIAEYLRYCNLSEGHAWCAAFVSWCHGQAGYPEPRNAWSPALFPEKRVVWQKGTRGTRAPAMPDGAPRPGDVFGIHYANLRRIGHCGFVDRWDGTWCETVEGNAEPDRPYNPRDGPQQGVHRKRRLVRTLYAVSRWTE